MKTMLKTKGIFRRLRGALVLAAVLAVSAGSSFATLACAVPAADAACCCGPDAGSGDACPMVRPAPAPVDAIFSGHSFDGPVFAYADLPATTEVLAQAKWDRPAQSAHPPDCSPARLLFSPRAPPHPLA